MKWMYGMLAIILSVSFFAAEAKNNKTTRHITFKNYESSSTQSQKKQTTQSRKTKYFQCDGRQHCSQMTSLAEAQFFLLNCPNVKMDGDNDGRPCEQQARYNRWAKQP